MSGKGDGLERVRADVKTGRGSKDPPRGQTSRSGWPLPGPTEEPELQLQPGSEPL